MDWGVIILSIIVILAVLVVLFFVGKMLGWTWMMLMVAST